MTYITRNDLVERFGEHEIGGLEDNIANSDKPDVIAKVSQSAIDDACSEADSYIAARYPLPIPSTPEPLKNKVCDIARYRLYKDQATEEVEKRYKEAISWLKDIASRKAVLVFGDDEPKTEVTPEFMSGIFVV